MPTIPEIKAELKALGVKGITGKNKAELMAMLEQAKAPKEAPKKKGPKIYRKPEIGDVSEPPIIAPKKPEIGDVSEPPKEAPKKKGPKIAPKKPEIGEDGLAELLGIIAKEVAGPVPAPALPPHETEEGEALQSFGQFIWRRFDSDEIKGLGKNVRRTAGGMFPMYAMDLIDVEDRFPTYWEEWNPIIGLTIPGVSGKALATCNPDGTISFTNIVLGNDRASYSDIKEAVVKEYREYGAGDLQPRYKKIAEALTSMRVLNKGKKSQGVKKPSKEEIEDFVRSELIRIEQMRKAKEEAEKMMPRETPLQKHNRIAEERQKEDEERRKKYNRIAEERQKEDEERRKKPFVLKKASPPPIIPSVIKKDMKEKLTHDYDLHEYNIGMAQPIDDMIKWFKKVQNQDTYWGKNAGVAYNFIRFDLIVWVKTNAYIVQEYPFGGRAWTRPALLLSDWEDFFKANR